MLRFLEAILIDWPLKRLRYEPSERLIQLKR